MGAYARGYRNTAFYNRHASGDTTYFPSKRARDAALAKLRDHAVDRGLSPSAARYGIVPVSRRFPTARERDAFLANLQEYPDHAGGNYAADVDA